MAKKPSFLPPQEDPAARAARSAAAGAEAAAFLQQASRCRRWDEKWRLESEKLGKIMENHGKW
jgi:hypothetical protein